MKKLSLGCKAFFVFSMSMQSRNDKTIYFSMQRYFFYAQHTYDVQMFYLFQKNIFCSA